MWNLSSNISINKHKLYTNTISDREIHVSMEYKFKTFLYMSNIYTYMYVCMYVCVYAELITISLSLVDVTVTDLWVNK